MPEPESIEELAERMKKLEAQTEFLRMRVSLLETDHAKFLVKLVGDMQRLHQTHAELLQNINEGNERLVAFITARTQ